MILLPTINQSENSPSTYKVQSGTTNSTLLMAQLKILNKKCDNSYKFFSLSRNFFFLRNLRSGRAIGIKLITTIAPFSDQTDKRVSMNHLLCCMKITSFFQGLNFD